MATLHYEEVDITLASFLILNLLSANYVCIDILEVC